MARFAARFVAVPAAAGVAAVLLLQGLGAVDLLGAPPATRALPAVRALPVHDGGPLSDDPFAGTPAESFPAGSDGILLPAAEPRGGLTAAQVRTALKGVKEILVAAQLNPETLFHRAHEPLLAALPADQRSSFLSHLDDAVDRKANTRSWMTAFKPGSAVLEGATIKVDGRFFLIAARGGGVRISTDHLFVYPVHAPGYPVEWVTIVTRRTLSVLATRDGDGVRLRLEDTRTTNSGTACSPRDGFVHPVYPGSGEAVYALADPYDLSNEIGEQSCLTLGG